MYLLLEVIYLLLWPVVLPPPPPAADSHPTPTCRPAPCPPTPPPCPPPPGTVLKRFDATKLYALACQDCVERAHLLVALAFVVVEEMGNSGSAAPNRRLLAQCARVFGSEVVIDIIKHAVLGKFNEIR